MACWDCPNWYPELSHSGRAASLGGGTYGELSIGLRRSRGPHFLGSSIFFSPQSVWFRGLWVLFRFYGFVAGPSGQWTFVVDWARFSLEKPSYPSYSLSQVTFHRGLKTWQTSQPDREAICTELQYTCTFFQGALGMFCLLTGCMR